VSAPVRFVKARPAACVKAESWIIEGSSQNRNKWTAKKIGSAGLGKLNKAAKYERDTDDQICMWIEYIPANHIKPKHYIKKHRISPTKDLRLLLTEKQIGSWNTGVTFISWSHIYRPALLESATPYKTRSIDEEIFSWKLAIQEKANTHSTK
jgi:hypothetical protein